MAYRELRFWRVSRASALHQRRGIPGLRSISRRSVAPAATAATSTEFGCAGLLASGCRGAICIQIKLTLLDTILHLATGCNQYAPPPRRRLHRRCALGTSYRRESLHLTPALISLDC